MWTQQPNRSTVVSSSKQRCIIHHLVRQSIIELDTCRPLAQLAPSRLDNNPATKLVKSNMQQVNKTITRSLSFCFISSNDDALVNTRPNTLWNKTIPICNTFGDNGANPGAGPSQLTAQRSAVSLYDCLLWISGAMKTGVPITDQSIPANKIHSDRFE